MVDKDTANLAKAIVVWAFRNAPIEDIHAGISPQSKTGDFTDVYVHDAEGNEIPWVKVSHITDTEMKKIMKFAVDRIHLFLKNPSDQKVIEDLEFSSMYTRKWDDPEEIIEPNFTNE